MLLRKMSVTLFLFAALVPCAHAQRDWQITPFFGARWGGTIPVNTANVDYLTIRNTYDFGATLDVSLWGDSLMPEFMWNRQPTEINAHSLFNGSLSPLASSNLDEYQFDILYQFRSSESKLRPFAVAGLGFTHFSNIEDLVGFGSNFSYNIGGGVKYFLNDHWGLRAEVRWSPSHTTPGVAEECSYFVGYCGEAQVANRTNQGQANIGIIYHFMK